MSTARIYPFLFPYRPKESRAMSKQRKDDDAPGVDELEIPGRVIEVDPEQAAAMGAFEEDAISLEDALEAAVDNDDVTDEEEAGNAG